MNSRDLPWSNDVLVEMINEGAALRSPEALAMVRAMELVGPSAVHAHARGVGAELNAAGSDDPGWVALVGRPEVIEAWGYGDDRNARHNVQVR